MEATGLFRKKNIILAGDLNLTTSSSEIWGQKDTSDPLSVFFKSIFQRNSLIYVIPNNPLLTWKNGHEGTESISKRLDRFFIVEELLASSQKYRSWVQLPFLSDHAPICLELG
jgi:endonuclease/exonuclease/phosphatase family metal-dependent hydrolase